MSIYSLVFHLISVVCLIITIYNYTRIRTLEKRMAEENAKATFAKNVLLDLDSKISHDEIDSSITNMINKGLESDLAIEDISILVKDIIAKRKETIEGMEHGKQ